MKSPIGSAASASHVWRNCSNSRMIASVIETPSGNWFVKVVGPVKTVAAHEKRIRDFVKRAKLKDSPHS